MRWGSCELPSIRGPVRVELRVHELGWTPDDTTVLRTAYDFAIVGIQNHYRAPGLGAALIAIQEPPDPQRWTPADRFAPRRHGPGFHPIRWRRQRARTRMACRTFRR